MTAIGVALEEKAEHILRCLESSNFANTPSNAWQIKYMLIYMLINKLKRIKFRDVESKQALQLVDSLIRDSNTNYLYNDTNRFFDIIKRNLKFSSYLNILFFPNDDYQSSLNAFIEKFSPISSDYDVVLEYFIKLEEKLKSKLMLKQEIPCHLDAKRIQCTKSARK